MSSTFGVVFCLFNVGFEVIWNFSRYGFLWMNSAAKNEKKNSIAGGLETGFLQLDGG
ncbi:hypothetical protein PMG71_16880 [Roseofilum sp. BLCC_M154]|uniref:Uncharacterized protein n=1 Tax=Roseofilum acuticapitatum BLCC-M154 TaxID=3022444 RepID=A0ABT7AW09_9CYAN|nr:hypothetical protein [Roseofilum acuticapitatum]MDJ1171106.1 hypothetical protein [Roseofilum acuticapitatum BLCC-M154]